MKCYSVQPRDQIIVKGYGFLSLAKNMSKTLVKHMQKHMQKRKKQIQSETS